MREPVADHSDNHASTTQAPTLDAWHFAQIARSGRALAKARKADRVAGFSGLTILLGGLLFLPFSLGSGFGMAFGVALGVVGWRELSLRKDIRALDPLGYARLARNQLVLASLISVYGITKLLGPVPVVQGIDAGLEGLGTDFAATAQRIATITHYGVGAGIIVLAWLIQGGQAMYYASVGRSMRSVHAQFPVWVMRVHAAAWGGKLPVPAEFKPGAAPGSDHSAPAPTDDTAEPVFLGEELPETGASAA